MKRPYDYIIIGAGPAGMAAAVRAASLGLSVALLDEQHSPGGQIYRAIDKANPPRLAILGRDYAYGKTLADRFRSAPVDYFNGTAVWHVTPDKTVYYLKDGTAGCLNGKRLLIATGAMERPVPIPGWTLPGVIGAGAVDVMLKSSGMVPKGRLVLAGTGPLLYQVTCHLIECGADVEALLDTKSFEDYFRSARLVYNALPGFKYLLKGLALHMRIIKSRVPHYRNISGLHATGIDHLERVAFTSDRKTHTIQADTLILHDGVVPNTQITRLLNCEHSWDTIQHYWRPKTDSWGNSSLSDISVAGDTGGIYGARSAEICGDLAALDTAFRLNSIPINKRDAIAIPLRKRLMRERAVRPFLDSIFTPSTNFFLPPQDDTIVCRCEEITAGQIRKTALESGMAPNAVKAKLRCGMGPCQGRLCGLTVSEIIAEANHAGIEDAGYFRIRPPLKPIPLSALANMEINE
jgi:thioredoxin reductase